MASKLVKTMDYWLVFVYIKQDSSRRKIALMLICPCRFYYADEHTPEGFDMRKGITASAHAEMYLQLMEGTVEDSWNGTLLLGMA